MNIFSALLSRGSSLPLKQAELTIHTQICATLRLYNLSLGFFCSVFLNSISGKPAVWTDLRIPVHKSANSAFRDRPANTLISPSTAGAVSQLSDYQNLHLPLRGHNTDTVPSSYLPDVCVCVCPCISSILSKEILILLAKWGHFCKIWPFWLVFTF